MFLYTLSPSLLYTPHTCTHTHTLYKPNNSQAISSGVTVSSVPSWLTKRQEKGAFFCHFELEKRVLNSQCTTLAKLNKQVIISVSLSFLWGLCLKAPRSFLPRRTEWISRFSRVRLNSCIAVMIWTLTSPPPLTAIPHSRTPSPVRMTTLLTGGCGYTTSNTLCRPIIESG